MAPAAWPPTTWIPTRSNILRDTGRMPGVFVLEAAAGLVEYAFSELGVKRLVASMAAENAASVKVAERLGMTFVGSAEKELNGVVYEGRR